MSIVIAEKLDLQGSEVPYFAHGNPMLPPLRKEHMRRSRGKLERQEAASIAINGKRLDTVEMLLSPPGKNVIAHQLYPSHRVKMTPYGGGLRMQMPAPLALELYRTGVIPQGESPRFFLSIDGREERAFQVIDFRYDNRDGREMVQMTLTCVEVSSLEPTSSLALKPTEFKT